jgi:hypothetical protein
MNRFERLCKKMPDCTGYFIDRLSMSRIEDSDALDIRLPWGQGSQI